MQGIKAGVVVVNRFCSPGSNMFFSYIDYMDREEAIRNETVAEYNLFNDYMGNPQKTSGLFTDGKRQLSKEEVSELKERFSNAQENQSLMWQTVISFDNRWLEEYGLYDSKTRTLNEEKIKETANVAINKMLRNEGLEQALWTAAFHYNTDNIHIHIATVEEIPRREKRLYQQYSYVTNEKNRLVKDNMIVDLHGNPVFEEEYKGKFKKSSFELCKQYIVKEIMKDKSLNQDINKLIRERMVRAVKANEILRDPELAQMVLELQQKLPNVSKNLWNYNNNIMAPFRAELNQISEFYLKKYHAEEFAQLQQMLKKQTDMYKDAYGESNKNRDYQKTKMQDLYTRMGNSILKSIKSLENEKTPDTYLFQAEQNDVASVTETDVVFETQDEKQSVSKEVENYYLEWENKFKKARYEISEYSKGNETISEKKAYKALHSLKWLDRKGSVLAKYELGGIYKYGKLKLQDDEFAYQYYQDALKGYEYIYENLEDYLAGEKIEFTEENKVFYQDYTTYRIGQMYNKGLGTETDYQKALHYFEISNSSYAKYALGELYFEGLGVEQNYEKAANYYKAAISTSEKTPNPYALYRLGQMHYKVMFSEADPKVAQEYFKEALSGFQKWDKGYDMFLKYRIGYMYYNGYGTEKNLNKAVKYFEDSLKLGNTNAKCMLGLIYTDRGSSVYDLKKGLAYLEEEAQEGNIFAMYKAGIIYLDKETEVYNLEKGNSYLKKVAEQGDSKAQYELGKLYTNPEQDVYDLKLGIEYLGKAAEQGHGFAMYRLGMLHMNQKLPVYDFEKGLDYLIHASEQEVVPAWYELGKIYTNPEQDVYDLKLGIEYLGKAAEQGHGFAMYRLGMLHMNQKLPVYDFEKGLDYLIHASEQEVVPAWYELGKIYTNPEQDVYDLKLGIEYLEKVAEQGHNSAMYKLGTIYVNPNSEFYDLQKGEKYLQEAMNMGNDYAACKLGDVYYHQKHDITKAVEYYKHASDHGNIYAKNQILKMAAGKQGNYVRKNWEFEKALRELKKSFEKDYKAWKNIMEHDAMLERKLKENNQELD